MVNPLSLAIDDLAWSLIGLEECADWTKNAAVYFGEIVQLTISQIARNDVETLSAINEMIEILERASI